ncbi:MAG: Gfo/Idh/MocA family protein [Thermoproteota archaeon]
MIKVGIAGSGGISYAHANAYLSLKERVKVVAVSDVELGRAEALAKYLGGAKVYSDYKDMIESEDIDAVDICLPHHIHKEAILYSIKKEKHVICEKPLTTNLNDAEEIEAKVKESKVVFLPAHTNIFIPSTQEAKRIIAMGMIGKILTLRTTDCFRGNVTGWRTKKELMGGGELIDTGYHPTYLMLYLASSEPIEVFAYLERFVQKMEGEDTAMVLIKFKDNSIGLIHSSWAYDTPYGHQYFSVSGEYGELFGGGNKIGLKMHGWQEVKKELAWKDGFLGEIEHFINVIEKKEKPIQTIEDSLKVMKVIAAAYKSAEEGKPIRL